MTRAAKDEAIFWAVCAISCGLGIGWGVVWGRLSFLVMP